MYGLKQMQIFKSILFSVFYTEHICIGKGLDIKELQGTKCSFFIRRKSKRRVEQNKRSRESMQNNPANKLKDFMWQFLMDKGQRANIPALKENVYTLIAMTTQKTAGQKKGIGWSELDMVLFSVIVEATALVLSGELDKIEGGIDVDTKECDNKP